MGIMLEWFYWCGIFVVLFFGFSGVLFCIWGVCGVGVGRFVGVFGEWVKSMVVLVLVGYYWLL